MKKIGMIIFFIVILILSAIMVLSEINSSDNITILQTENLTSNITVTNVTEFEKIEILSFIPTNFTIGDTRFNIRILNNHSMTLSNIFPIITGRGFSTYDTVPIDSLLPGEKDYLIISGNFKESGIINLSIIINNEIFSQQVYVANLNEGTASDEQNKKEILSKLYLNLSDLKQKYSTLEIDYFNKKDNNYDLSKLNLDDLKSYIKNAEISIANEDIKNSNAQINLAYECYTDQKKKIDEANPKTISALSKIKDYALIFSTIAGALITFFALSELLKKKSQVVVGTIKKVNFYNTKKINEKKSKK